MSVETIFPVVVTYFRLVETNIFVGKKAFSQLWKHIPTGEDYFSPVVENYSPQWKYIFLPTRTIFPSSWKIFPAGGSVGCYSKGIIFMATSYNLLLKESCFPLVKTGLNDCGTSVATCKNYEFPTCGNIGGFSRENGNISPG